MNQIRLTQRLVLETDVRPMTIDIEPCGAIVVRWPWGLTMMTDPVGCWAVLAGKVVRVTVGLA